MALAEIGAKLSLKGASSFKRDADRAAGSLDKFGRQARQADRQVSGLENAAGKAGRSLEKMGKRAAIGLAGLTAGAVAGGIVVMGDSIQKAASLGETLSKTNNVFKDSAKDIIAWSKDSARAFGLSQQQALAAASQYGNMFLQLGFTGKAAVASSKQMVKLAADLGSFNDVEPTDVLERIGAALRGEFDSLQALIPNINAARVEQEAMALSGKKTAKALTAQEKAAATLAIITKDGALANNDFAETSDGLTNQQRILRAQLDNTKTMIGRGLLPVMTDLATWANDEVVPAIQRFIDQFERGVGPGGEFKATLGGIRDTAADAWPHIESLYGKTKTVVDFVIQHKDAFTVITAGVAGYAAAMKSAAIWSATMGTNGPKAAAGMTAAGGAAKVNTAKVAGFATVLSRAAGAAGVLAGLYFTNDTVKGTLDEIGGGIKKVGSGIKNNSNEEFFGGIKDVVIGDLPFKKDKPKAVAPSKPRPGGSSQDRNMKPKTVVDVLTPGTATRRGTLTTSGGGVAVMERPTMPNVEVPVFLNGREVGRAVIDDMEDRVARR